MRDWVMHRWMLGAASCLVVLSVAGCGGDGAVGDAGALDATPAIDATTADGGEDCASDAACDDGLFCNGVEACVQRRCQRGTPVACDDGVACTVDRCSEERRTCVNTPPDADGDGVFAASCLDARGAPFGDDCDDEDATRFPGATEVCDALAHDEDCDPTTLGGTDRDGDTAIADSCCNGATCGTDCNDARADVRPGAGEICNFVDDDCNGMVDEGVSVAGFVDDDADGFGSSVAITACNVSARFAVRSGDCDDANPARYPNAPEVCDGVDNDCDGLGDDDEPTVSADWYLDADGDGYGDANATPISQCVPPTGHVLNRADCDDSTNTRSPAVPEVCDGVDNDCNGSADYVITPGNLEDDDRDGLADVACGAPRGVDCADNDPATGPGSTEICDARDNDCDGNTDEGIVNVGYYRDLDGDGFGSDANGVVIGCAPRAGYVERAGDCDDTGRSGATRYPGATELCNNLDDDCDAATDEALATLVFYRDRDGDGVGAVTSGTRESCRAIDGFVATDGDCNDDLATARPGGTESCNGTDDDCDGRTDEGFGVEVFYADRDGDGFGNNAERLEVRCGTQPAPYVSSGGDCDDTSPTRRPGGTEVCNGVDDDCDGPADENPTTLCTAGNNASWTCVSGSCVVASCSAGFADCTAATGCETATSSDPLRCGGCNACPIAGSLCSAGSCRPDLTLPRVLGSADPSFSAVTARTPVGLRPTGVTYSAPLRVAPSTVLTPTTVTGSYLNYDAAGTLTNSITYAPPSGGTSAISAVDVDATGRPMVMGQWCGTGATTLCSGGISLTAGCTAFIQVTGSNGSGCAFGATARATTAASTSEFHAGASTSSAARLYFVGNHAGMVDTYAAGPGGEDAMLWVHQGPSTNTVVRVVQFGTTLADSLVDVDVSPNDTHVVVGGSAGAGTVTWPDATTTVNAVNAGIVARFDANGVFGWGTLLRASGSLKVLGVAATNTTVWVVGDSSGAINVNSTPAGISGTGSFVIGLDITTGAYLTGRVFTSMLSGAAIDTDGTSVFVGGSITTGAATIGSVVLPASTTGGFEDGFVASFDASLGVRWARRFPSRTGARVTRLALQSSTTLLASGTFETSVELGPSTLLATGNSDMFSVVATE